MANLKKLSNEALRDLLNNMITNGTADLAAVGWVAADVAAIQAALDAWDADELAAAQAHEAAKAATAQAAGSKAAALEVARLKQSKALALAGLTPQAAIGIGIPQRDLSPTAILPVTPTDLTATASPDGKNTLKWKTTGNKQGTTYVVETRTGSSGVWSFLAVATKGLYVHAGQTPGVRVEYRVKAVRASGESDYSNTAVVY